MVRSRSFLLGGVRTAPAIGTMAHPRDRPPFCGGWRSRCLAGTTKHTILSSVPVFFFVGGELAWGWAYECKTEGKEGSTYWFAWSLIRYFALRRFSMPVHDGFVPAIRHVLIPTQGIGQPGSEMLLKLV
jgi:hypothetical protein